MIIITGGAGFIGSNTVKGLNEIGEKKILIVDKIINMDKTRHSNLDLLKYTDFVDKNEFINNLKKYSKYKISTIFHFGASTNTMENNKKEIMKNNYEYSKKVLEFAINNSIKFIYASSASIYGHGKNGFFEDTQNQTPLNIYAESKYLFDQYIRQTNNNFSSNIVGLRYFNIYGPKESHKDKMASVIFQFHNQIINQNKIKLFKGSKNFKRDFIYINDIVDINLYFYKKNYNGIYNCGTGKAVSFLKIAKIMQKLYNNPIIEYIDFPDKLKNKYQIYTKADLTKLRKIANYNKTFTKLKNGIKKYVNILKST